MGKKEGGGGGGPGSKSRERGRGRRNWEKEEDDGEEEEGLKERGRRGRRVERGGHAAFTRHGHYGEGR